MTCICKLPYLTASLISTDVLHSSTSLNTYIGWNVRGRWRCSIYQLVVTSPRLSFVAIGLHNAHELRHVGCESPLKLNSAQMLSRQSVACRSQRQTTLAKTVRRILEYNQEASLSTIETEISTVAIESSVHVCQCEIYHCMDRVSGVLWLIPCAAFNPVVLRTLRINAIRIKSRNLIFTCDVRYW